MLVTRRKVSHSFSGPLMHWHPISVVDVMIGCFREQPNGTSHACSCRKELWAATISFPFVMEGSVYSMLEVVWKEALKILSVAFREFEQTSSWLPLPGHSLNETSLTKKIIRTGLKKWKAQGSHTTRGYSYQYAGVITQVCHLGLRRKYISTQVTK